MTGRRRRAHGEGSVYEQRPGLWAASIDLGWIDGKRKRKTVYAKSEKEAIRMRADLRRRQEQGENLAATPRTLPEWRNEWMTMKEHEGTRQSTLRGYSWLIESHIRPTLGRVTLDKLTPTMIRRVLTAKTGEGLSAATVRHIHGMIRNVLSDAKREELLHRNPALAVRAPTVRPVERRSLTVDEAKRLIDSIRGDRLEALWVCALTVGLRRGELRGLRWSDVDFVAGTLTVRQTVLRVRGISSSPHRRRTVPDERFPYLFRLLPCCEVTAASKRRSALRPTRGGRNTAWCSRPRSARRWSRATSTGSGTPLASAPGLSWLRLHDLRHACATFLLASGASPRTVMQTLGHSQIGLTMNTYAHVLAEVERAAMDAAAQRLFGSDSKT